MMPSKRAVMEAALDQPGERPGTVLVLFWAHHPDVVLPDVMLCLAEEETLKLRYSYRYRPPPEVDDLGIRATLEKQGQSYDTFVPWDAVSVILEEWSGAHMSWPVYASEPAEEAVDPTPTPPKPAARGHLRLLTQPENDND